MLIVVNLIEIFFARKRSFPEWSESRRSHDSPSRQFLFSPSQLLQLLRGCQTLRGRSSRFKIAAAAVVAAHKSFLGLVDDSDFNFTYFIAITD